MSDKYIMSPVEQFRDAIRQKGLVPPPMIETDGELYRFSSSGKRGDDAGWYVYYESKVPFGLFGDFRTGVRVPSWQADMGRELSPAEKDEQEKKISQAQREKQAKKLKLQAEARIKAAGVARISVPAPDSHPHLIKKNIGAHGIGIWENPDVTIRYSKKTGKPFLQLTAKNGGLQVGFGVELGEKSVEEVIESWKSVLLIPMRDGTGTLQSFQFISKDGDKKFLYGGMMEGCYFTIGDINNSPTILFAEGYSTSATLYEASGYPVVDACNAGNLLIVAQSIRAQRPDARFIFCADDDWKTMIRGEPYNTGTIKANEAAEVVGGTVLVPEFGPDRPDGATDYNDMAALEGKDAVTDFFTRHSLGRRNNMPSISYDNDNSSESFTAFSRPDATLQPTPSVKKPPTGGRVFTGTITDFGPAPYRKNPDKDPSYFITVASGESEKTVWGVDLGKALGESGFTVGDKVAIYDMGKVPVQVVVKTRDATGKVIHEETKTVSRNEWHIGSLEEYIASRLEAAQEMVAEAPLNKPDAVRAQSEAPAAAPLPSPRNAPPAPEPKLHFLDAEFKLVQEIWKNVPRQAARHSEDGYDILLDDKNKVRVTQDRIELAKKSGQRPDAAYIAACEHARHFWNGEISIQGDAQHRIKAYAFATAYGIKVTNYAPSDSELIEATRIMDQFYKGEETGFHRPAAVKPQAGSQPSPPIR